MNFQELLKNKTILFSIIGGVAAIIIFILIIAIFSASSSNSSKGGTQVIKSTPLEADVELLTTDNLGKALEIQALLAKEGIRVSRGSNGSKSSLILPKKTGTMEDRDRALIAIVKSGYMDQNVGLEIFDKGDFTSTKEDKRIRLSRAINGELSRLIRKIPPIESASVFVSIPEQSMFTADKKPITATVQLVMPSGERLDDLKIRAIENLLLGSINGLTAQNISVTDTNGNVYNSVISPEDDLLAKMQENDKYMTEKVQAQLNKLVGKGNYVVTVSTHLREAPIEKTSLIYNPEAKTAVAEQTFTEGLGDKSEDKSSTVNAVTTYLPSGLPNTSGSSAQNRNYSRSAKEVQYGVSKTQVSELIKPGVVEEIAIAVTLEQDSLPVNMSIDELKMLIASAASPKAEVSNVTIAFSDKMDPFLASEKPASLPVPDPSGNPWWIAAALLFVGLVFGFNRLQGKFKADALRQKQELEALREKSLEQERQLQDVNLKAAELIERQTQLAQGLIEQQQQVQQNFQQIQNQQQHQIQQNTQRINQPVREENYIPELMDTISNITNDIEELDDEETAEEILSWIERS